MFYEYSWLLLVKWLFAASIVWFRARFDSWSKTSRYAGAKYTQQIKYGSVIQYLISSCKPYCHVEDIINITFVHQHATAKMNRSPFWPWKNRDQHIFVRSGYTRHLSSEVRASWDLWGGGASLPAASQCTSTESPPVRMSPFMLIAHKGHNNTIQVYSVTVMSHLKNIGDRTIYPGDISA